MTVLIVVLILLLLVAITACCVVIDNTNNHKDYVADFDPGWMERKIHENEARIDEVDLEIFKLKNPPKYQIGQEVMARGYRGYVVNIENNPMTGNSQMAPHSKCTPLVWDYSIFIPAEGCISKYSQNMIIPLKTKKRRKK